MYKNILIISDNIILCEQFAKILSTKKFDSVEWTFSVSPSTDIDEFQKKLDIEIKCFDLKKNADVDEILKKYDLILSMHCTQIFPDRLVENLKCINIHPGYNPINRGWYPQVFAIIHNLPIGATIHEMDSKIDHGDIIDRSYVDKYVYDTSETLYKRIIQKEVELLDKNIENIVQNNYTAVKPESGGRFFLKKDFNDLKQIHLDEKTTTIVLINKLRALTHGKYKNLYFIDPSSGRRIFVSIKLQPEDP